MGGYATATRHRALARPQSRYVELERLELVGGALQLRLHNRRAGGACQANPRVVATSRADAGDLQQQLRRPGAAQRPRNDRTISRESVIEVAAFSSTN